MAVDAKISELPVATTPGGTELIEIVQGGVNKQTTVQDIADLAAGGVTSVNGLTGAVTGIGVIAQRIDQNNSATTSAQLAATISDETGTGFAVFSDSPALTGTPTTPTAAPGTNTTQLATTAFVQPTEANVTLANGVVTINFLAADVQHMTISENKVITTISNPLVGKSILVTLDGTFSMSFSTITAVVEGQYNAGEVNRVFILCTKVSGGVTYRITFDNSLSNAFDVDSAAFIGLTDAATVAWSVGANELFSNRTVTIAGNRTFGAPTGMSDGTVGTCWVTASGAIRTISIPAGTSHKLKGVGDDTFKTITIPSGETYIISWQYNSALAVWVWWYVD